MGQAGSNYNTASPIQVAGEMLILQEVLLLLDEQDWRKKRPRRLLTVLERFRAAQKPENVTSIFDPEPPGAVGALAAAINIMENIAGQGAARFGLRR